MSIYTSSFEKMKNVNNDRFIYISIARGGVPSDFPHKVTRGITDMMPSWKLVKEWKSGAISWDEYTRLFKIETNFNDNIIWFKIFLNDLQIMYPDKDIVILCYCPTGNCHRHIVGEPVGAVELTDEKLASMNTASLDGLAKMAESIPNIL